jgi:hypothetical protein
MPTKDTRPRTTVPFSPADYRLVSDGATAAGVSITALIRSGALSAARAALRDAGKDPAEYLELAADQEGAK